MYTIVFYCHDEIKDKGLFRSSFLQQPITYVRKLPVLTITLFNLYGKLRKCANHAAKNVRYRRSICIIAGGGQGTFILIRL